MVFGLGVVVVVVVVVVVAVAVAVAVAVVAVAVVAVAVAALIVGSRGIRAWKLGASRGLGLRNYAGLGFRV